MEYIINAKNTTVTDPIRDYIEKKFSKFGKYVPDDTKVHTRIEVKDNGNRHKVEVTIVIGKQTFRAEYNDKDMYTAIDMVEKTMVRMLKRRKEKLEDRHRQRVAHDVSAPAENDYFIARIKTHDIVEMTAQEACEAMDMIGHPFYVYMDVDKHQTCAVYKREDGTYGQLIYN